jgi:hypothetical protein
VTQPVRIGSDLFESARRAGAAQERSAAQQLSLWARIGRELEASSAMSVADHAQLARASAYDELSPSDQALVRAQWETAMLERIATLDLPAKLAAEGRRYAVVGDAQGRAKRLALKEPVGKPARPRVAKKTTAPKKRATRRASA